MREQIAPDSFSSQKRPGPRGYRSKYTKVQVLYKTQYFVTERDIPAGGA